MAANVDCTAETVLGGASQVRVSGSASHLSDPHYPASTMTDRLERLLNLVIALRETRRPMTAEDIRERVAGYGQPEAEAFRRMFERDKADLRALGVPVETASLDRYDDRLAADELAALALALQATGRSDEAGAGLLKLEVDAGEPGATDRYGAPRLGVALDAPHRAALMEAQLTRTTVRFRYRPAGRDVGPRTVDPWALVHRRGRWYLVGHDQGRGERRAFRLDRIEGAVKPVGAPGGFPPPPRDVGVDDVVPPPARSGPDTATVVAAADVAWQVARRARGGGTESDGGWTTFTVSVVDPDDFVSWVLEFGPDVRVVDPPELRDAVVERLEALLR
jgi:predicted DNA-binding transcriptional regulator YafY